MLRHRAGDPLYAAGEVGRCIPVAADDRPDEAEREGDEGPEQHHGHDIAKGDGGEGVVEDCHRVEEEGDAKAQAYRGDRRKVTRQQQVKGREIANQSEAGEQNEWRPIKTSLFESLAMQLSHLGIGWPLATWPGSRTCPRVVHRSPPRRIPQRRM